MERAKRCAPMHVDEPNPFLFSDYLRDLQGDVIMQDVQPFTVSESPGISPMDIDTASWLVQDWEMVELCGSINVMRL